MTALSHGAVYPCRRRRRFLRVATPHQPGDPTQVAAHTASVGLLVLPRRSRAGATVIGALAPRQFAAEARRLIGRPEPELVSGRGGNSGGGAGEARHGRVGGRPALRCRRCPFRSSAAGGAETPSPLGVAALDAAPFSLLASAPKHRGEAERICCRDVVSSPTRLPIAQVDEDVDDAEGEKPADDAWPPTLDARGEDECSCSWSTAADALSAIVAHKA